MHSEHLDQAPSHRGQRREFLSTTATWSMAGGLVASYGTLAALAVRFLYPTERSTAWTFVAPLGGISPGESTAFESPAGARVTIQRRPASDPARPVDELDFIALSNVCPHLGCRVHWEPHNDRFFCPCHNGQFDHEGRATGGPPKAAGQHLPRYRLKVEQGLLFIELPLEA